MSEIDTRFCTKCQSDRPAEEFKYKQRHWCKLCQSEYNRQYFLAKPEKFKPTAKRKLREKDYYQLRKDKIREKNAKIRHEKVLIKQSIITKFKMLNRKPTKSKDFEIYLPNNIWGVNDTQSFTYNLHNFPIESDCNIEISDYAYKLLGEKAPARLK